MITAVAQTLAELLTSSSALLSTVQIDLSHPSQRLDIRPAISLYLYDLRQNLEECDLNSTQGVKHDSCKDEEKQTQTQTYVFWFDLSFVIIPWDWTELGKARILSEVLQLLLSHPVLREDTLAPEAQGYGDLRIRVAPLVPDVAALWNALHLPLQPALYITIKTPFPIAVENCCNHFLSEK